MAAITIEDAMIQLQSEMRGTRSQLAEMATAHDELREAVTKLESVSSAGVASEGDRKFAEQAAAIEKMEVQLQRLLFTQKFDLLDAKAMTPEVYRGKRTEAFKPWARKLKHYCNAKRSGFRKALDWAEKEEEEIPIHR